MSIDLIISIIRSRGKAARHIGPILPSYGGGGSITLVVDCKHTGCFSCYVEKDVIMGGGGGGVNNVGC